MELYTNKKKIHSVIASLYGADEKINRVSADEAEFLIKGGDEMAARQFAGIANDASRAITNAIHCLTQMLEEENEDE